MNSIHTITDYQTTSPGRAPVLGGFPSLDSAHDIIFRPVQPNATRRDCYVQTAEDKHHSPIPQGPSRLTHIALSAVAAGVSGAANTYSQAAIYRELSAHSQRTHSTEASLEEPAQRAESSPSSFDDAANGQHGTIVETNETEPSISPISAAPSSNTDQIAEPTQGDVGSLEIDTPSTIPSQNQDFALDMNASSQNANQQSQTLTSTESKSPNAEAHQKQVHQGDIEVRIRSRGADIGSGATEYSSSYDQQQRHTRDLGVRLFNHGRESSFMPIGSAQSLLDLEPGAENRELAGLVHRRLGFGSHVLFDFRNTVSGQSFTVPLPVQHGVALGGHAFLYSEALYDLRDSLLQITPK